MKIMQVSRADVLGGAERVAWMLFEGYRRRGHGSWLAVGEKRSADRDVIEIPATGALRRVLRGMGHVLAGKPTGASSLRRRLGSYLANPGAMGRAVLGRDSFRYPGTARLLELTPERPEIVHCHNLHGSYFDLRALWTLGARVPIVATLHDAWLLTGGCTHPLDCQRFKSGCGKCPYMVLHFRASLMDSTAWNWRRKQRVLSKSRLHVVTPCQWLMDKVETSMLAPAVVSGRVIPNGVDLSVYGPAGAGSRKRTRQRLGLAESDWVVMHASANARRNASKDFATMRGACEIAARQAHRVGRRMVLLIVGDDGPPEGLAEGTGEIRFAGLVGAQEMAELFAGADVYLQGSIADTFPNTVLEAMACGLPVVATRVGGIPEQVLEGQTGYLVASGAKEEMAAALLRILSDEPLRRAMGERGAARVRTRFDVNRQITLHLEYFQEILHRE